MIKVCDYLSLDRIKILKETKKEEALLEMIKMFSNSGIINDIGEFEKAIFDRENIMSTSIGLGIAVPHVRLNTVTEMAMAVGVSNDGIDYKAFDDSKVYIIIMIAAPAGTHRQYLSFLAKIALLLKNDSIRDSILHAETPQEIFDALKGY